MDHNKLLAAVFNMPKLEGPGLVPPTNPTLAFEFTISRIIGLLTIVAVIYFIFQVIFAGYSFINSQGDPKAIDAAQKKLTYSILGLVIVVIAVGLGSLIASFLGIKNVLDIDAFFTSIGL